MLLQSLYTSSRWWEGVPGGGIEEIHLPDMPLKRLNVTNSFIWRSVSDNKPAVLEMDFPITIVLGKPYHLGQISG